MRWFCAACVTLVALTLGAVPALAQTVIGFDDLDAAAGDVSLDALSPYKNLTWSNFSAYTAIPGFDGFNNGIVSLGNAAYGGGQTFADAVVPVVGAIQSATAFDLLTADLGAGYYNGLSLTLTGYLGAAQLYTQTVVLGTIGAQAFTFDFAGIDRLTFTTFTTAATSDPFACGSFNCTQFTVDNLTIQAATTTAPIPEPSTTLLVALGLGLVATRSLRRRRPS